MNKKVMALAVAGALAVPGVALAQVTISGGFRMGVQQQSISNPNINNAVLTGPVPAAGATGVTNVTRTGLNTSETRVIDNVSQIIFSAREDLGGGLTATGRYEWRPTLDGSGAASGQTPNGTGCASNWVGIESTTMGTIRLGCVNTYAGAGGTGGPYTPDNFLALTSNVGLMQQGFTGGATAAAATGAAAYAQTQLLNFGQGRQANSVTWNSPNWNGFGLDLVWSSQNAGNDGDLAGVASARKGNAYIVGPKYTSGPFSAQYMYFSSKFDAATAILARDFKSNKIWATYNWSNGFSLTGVWANVTLTNSAAAPTAATLNAGGGSRLSDDNKWMISGQYLTGPYRFTGDYTRAASDKILGGGTGARQWAFGAGYSFSKRTDIGLSYTRVNNDALAAYGPQDTTNVSLGGNNDFGQAGETYTIWGVNLHHKF